MNETTRHADVILPAPSPLQRSHYDLALYQLAVRNVANYSPPVLPPDPGVPDEWATLLRLAGVAAGQPAPDGRRAARRLVAGELLRRETADAALAAARARRRGAAAELEPRRGPERLLDLLLRAGPVRPRRSPTSRRRRTASTSARSSRGCPSVLRTPSGRIELAPAPIVADVARLRDGARPPARAAALVLVGRRQLRSNNSWMHNLELLVSGPERCTLHVHPTTPSGSGSPTASRRACAAAPARWRRRSR